MNAVKDEVEARIAGRKVVVFSKSTCPFCRDAKKLLKGLVQPKDFKAYEIDSDRNFNCGDVQKYLYIKTKRRTVPQIFIKGKSMGGYDDILKVYKKEGKLEAMLKDDTTTAAGGQDTDFSQQYVKGHQI